MDANNQGHEKGQSKVKQPGKDRRVTDETVLAGMDRRKNKDRREESLKDEDPKDKGSG